MAWRSKFENTIIRVLRVCTRGETYIVASERALREQPPRGNFHHVATLSSGSEALRQVQRTVFCSFVPYLVYRAWQERRLIARGRGVQDHYFEPVVDARTV